MSNDKFYTFKATNGRCPGFDRCQYDCQNKEGNLSKIKSAYTKHTSTCSFLKDIIKNQKLPKLLSEPDLQPVVVHGINLQHFNLPTYSPSTKSKNFIDCQSDSQKKKLKTLGKQAQELHQPLIQSSYKLGIKSLQISSINGDVDGIPFKINYQTDYQKELQKKTEQSKLKKLVMAIDKGGVSQRGYRFIASVDEVCVREYLIQGERSRQDEQMQKEIPFHPMNGVEGFWRELDKILDKVFNCYNIEVGSTLKIKLSGDGRNVGKCEKEVMMTFSLLNAGFSSIPDHNFSLAIWKGSENYDDFKTCLNDLLNHLRKLSIEGYFFKANHYPIEFFLSADWKFLAIVLGLTSASAHDGFCIWCFCQAFLRANLNMVWPIQRCMHKIVSDFESSGKSQDPGQKARPLFDFIPYHRIIIDPLHLFLRIGGKLLNLLISEVLESSKAHCAVCIYRGKKKCSPSCSCLCHIDVQGTIEAEMKKNGIEFNFFKNAKGNLDWPSLNGNNLLKVMINFNLSLILPPSRVETISKLWKNFLDIIYFIDQPNKTIIQIEEFEVKVKAWFQLYLAPSVGHRTDKNFVQGGYTSDDVTPYLHCLYSHLKEFMIILLNQSLEFSDFSAEANEKKNHLQVQYFYAHTLKNGGNGDTPITAMLKIENRLLYFINEHSEELKKDFNIEKVIKQKSKILNVTIN